MRYFLSVAYNGQYFHGWQIQQNATSVQAEIEKAFSTLFQEKVAIVGSGRTDAGVHASGQIFHVDLNQKPDDLTQLIYRLNKILPHSIALANIWAVKEEAHARFNAVRRSYEYHIHMRKNPFKRELSYFYARPLDIKKMNEAAARLLNYTDFECFSKVKTDVYTFNCSIFEANWKQDNDLLVFYVSANRFLRGMVRAIVGTLLEVGEGKRSTSDFEKIIESKNRSMAGRSVPAHGLYLTEVEYPESVYLK